MGQRIVQVDAFADRPFGGNPAAVCVLEEECEAAWMQNVAMEMNLAETAFVKRRGDGSGDYDLRWFTPTTEVDLCGHATLASAHVLWEEGYLAPSETARFHTRSGLLTAQKQGAWIELDFPAEPATRVDAADIPTELLCGLGVNALFVGRNRMDYLIEVVSEEIVRGLRPAMGALERVAARGIIVTAQSNGSPYDFVSRFFGPAVGVDEDPVTGSAHCCLGPYWQSRLNKTTFTAYQASGRGGVVHVRVEGGRVKLGGQAITTLRGELSDAACNLRSQI